MSDLISRQAAIDALCDNCDNPQAVCAHYPCDQYVSIEQLPSATQQWIPVSKPPKELGLYWVTVDDYRSKERVTKLREYLGNENWERDGYEPPLAWMPLIMPEPWRGEEDD